MALNDDNQLTPRTGGSLNGDGEVTDGEDDRLPTVENDLEADADPEEFDRTFRIDRSDVPFATDEAPAIPRPWQGIPRVAITYNLTYVYDEDAGEWARQKKSDLSPFRLADEGELTVPDGVTTPVATTLTNEQARVTSYVNLQPTESIGKDWHIEEDNLSPTFNLILSVPQWDESAGRWDVAIFNDSQSSRDVQWQLYEVVGGKL